MSRRRSSDPAELLADPGVLSPTPSLEVFGVRAVTEGGGVAVVPHRGRWLHARESGIPAHGWFGSEADGPWPQGVVHLQKGRAATDEGLAEAWSRLDPGGRLLLVGGNDLGIKSAVKRLADALGKPAEILSNRARARVACWTKSDANLERPVVGPIAMVTDTGPVDLRSAPGVFSADGVDPGTAILLEHLESLSPPDRVFDPGCGLGVLGLAALRRWTAATAVLADVDHRAVDCARRNATDLGVGERCEVRWWDAVSEPPPLDDCDLVLVNPPFHTGVPVDLQPARAIFRAMDTALAPGGRALVIANRTLPWERDLQEIGRLRQITDTRGYKLMEIAR